MTDLVRADDSVMVGAETLAYLGLDPRKPEVHALVLLCQRYRLDPLLGHASIIKAAGGNKAYITRDGMLEIAHRSGQLDGIVVDDQHETEHGGHSATVSVWRKDMKHPFTYKGGCGHDEAQTKAGNGPEMALARAERRALRRAFSIPAYDDDEPYEETGEIIDTPAARRAEPAPHLSMTRSYRDEVRHAAKHVPLEWRTKVWQEWQNAGMPPIGHRDFTAQHAAELIAMFDNPPTPTDVIDSQPETVDEPAYRYDPDDNSGEPFE